MNRRQIFALFGASIVAPLAFSSAARACGPAPAFTKTLPMAGRKETTIKNVIKSDVTHEWILRGQPGQRVEVTLEGKKSGVTMMPDEAAATKKPQWGAAPKDGSFVKKWAGALPKSGRLLLEVSTEANRDSYTLVVKLV